MKTIKAKISYLVLLLGVVLILANYKQSEKLLIERSILRIEREADATGARLAGMMQHYLRKGYLRAAELEMSYAAVSSDLQHGLVCDQYDVVQSATRLEWRGLKLSDTPLAHTSEIAATSREFGEGVARWDEPRRELLVVLPFFPSF